MKILLHVLLIITSSLVPLVMALLAGYLLNSAPRMVAVLVPALVFVVFCGVPLAVVEWSFRQKWLPDNWS